MLKWDMGIETIKEILEAYKTNSQVAVSQALMPTVLVEIEPWDETTPDEIAQAVISVSPDEAKNSALYLKSERFLAGGKNVAHRRSLAVRMAINKKLAENG